MDETKTSSVEHKTFTTGHTIELSNRFFNLIAALIVVVAVFLLGYLSVQFQKLPQNFPRELSVVGEGKAYVKPDVALVSFGVNTRGFKSQDVVERNNQIMNQVIQSIKDSGVDSKDIKTTLYSLNPIYSYTERGRIFEGYSLDQQIRVKIRDFDNISSILDKATSLGANTVGDLQFTVDDLEKVRAEARAKAIDQAKEKAQNLVKEAGLKIDKLINVSEGYYGVAPYGSGGVTLKEDSIAPRIEPGQTEVSISITLTYRIK